MVRYKEIIDDLENSLNFKSTDEIKAKLNKQIFNNCLICLKEDFKTDVSTKYLMGFVVGDEKQKSNRVSYMLKSVGLNERKKITDCLLEKTPTLTTKDIEVYLYSSKKDKNNKERICLKVVPMTSYIGYIKAPCKVGVFSRKIRTISLNNVVL